MRRLLSYHRGDLAEGVIGLAQTPTDEDHIRLTGHDSFQVGLFIAQEIMENELVMGTDAYKNGHIVYLAQAMHIPKANRMPPTTLIIRVTKSFFFMSEECA